MKDLFLLSFINIKNKKLRSWLTIVGIILGVAAVVALYSIGKGMENSVVEEFNKIGVDKVIITVKNPLGPFGSITSTRLTTKDTEQVKKVRGIEEAADIAVGTSNALFQGHVGRGIIVRGVPPGKGFTAVKEVLNAEIAQGRFMKKGEKTGIVIGSDFIEDDNVIFGDRVYLNDRIVMNGHRFKVAGILKASGNPGVDRSIMLDKDAARELIYGDPEKTDIIIVKLKKGAVIASAEESISKRLRKFRHLKEGEEDFEVQTFQKAFESFFTVINIITYIVLAITLVSLVIGGIGIMNTMYTSVMERKKEIGIMKAIGAENRFVAMLFLVESGLIGVTGGIMGLIIGAGMSLGLSSLAVTYLHFPLLKPVFPYSLIISVFVFAFIVGVISGTYPAYKAAKIEPVKAIRGM